LVSGGSDSEDDGIAKNNFPTFKMPPKMTDYKWEVGTYFAMKQDFIDAVRTYAIHSGRPIKFKKNDKVRVRAVCKPPCQWNAFCARLPDQETWQLRKVWKGKHTCPRDFKVKLLSSKWLGTKLKPCVRENPKLRITDIMDKTQEKWKTSVTMTKAIRARTMAFDAVDGSFR